MTNEEVPLFDFEVPVSTLLPETPITAAQILEIQAAFATAEVENAVEQQRIVQSCSIRKVVVLEDLLAREVGPILKRIAQRQRSRSEPPTGGSAWDTREADTWIDKL